LLTRLRVAAWAQDRARVEAVDPEDAVHAEAEFLLRAYQRAALLFEPPPNVDLMRAAVVRGRNRRFALFLQQIAAELFCFTGQHDLAMRELTEGAEQGFIDLVWLDHCPVLAPLRTMPGFAEARRKVRARARSFEHAI
jgi:serine/threonine-protein kinase